jgi:hypothetical protein
VTFAARALSGSLPPLHRTARVNRQRGPE